MAVSIEDSIAQNNTVGAFPQSGSLREGDLELPSYLICPETSHSKDFFFMVCKIKLSLKFLRTETMGEIISVTV